jgi:putative transposase
LFPLFAEAVMSHAFYSEIHLHITWHTKANRPTLTPEVEKEAHAAIRRKATSHRGVVVHAVDGTEDHVHVAVSIPPNVTISEFIGQLKGYSSHAINQAFADRLDRFEWQVGYGVVSFGTRNLKWVVAYVNRQKEHHAKKTTFARLEQTQEKGDEPALEQTQEGDEGEPATPA